MRPVNAPLRARVIIVYVFYAPRARGLRLCVCGFLSFRFLSRCARGWVRPSERGASSLRPYTQCASARARGIPPSSRGRPWEVTARNAPTTSSTPT